MICLIQWLNQVANIIGNLMITHLEECGDDIKRIWIFSKYDGDQYREWNVKGLVESRDQNLSLRDKVGLGLFMDLRPMREYAITHKDV